MTFDTDLKAGVAGARWFRRYAFFIASPTPRNLNYGWVFGAILSFMLVLQIVTGVILARYYVPNSEFAFTSVERIVRDVNYGWLLRTMHAVGTSMFFFALYLHMLRGLYYGSYKEPRKVLWILGVVIYLLMMATTFTGYLLPWGQMSYWGTTVIMSMLSAIPLVGDWIVRLLWGGYSVGGPALRHFFSLHYLLPFVIAGVAVLHVWTRYITGQNNPDGVAVQSEKDTVAFMPYATIKDLFGIAVFAILFAYLVFYMPNYFGMAENYIEADPGMTPWHIVPEWYFLPFYAILRAVPCKLGGVVAMVAAVLVLALLPWLDFARTRSLKYRPLAKVAFWGFVVVCLLLGYLGAQAGEEPFISLSRILSVLYFAYFFPVLPLLALVETPRAVPNAIADAVLRKAKKTAAMLAVALIGAGALLAVSTTSVLGRAQTAAEMVVPGTVQQR